MQMIPLALLNPALQVILLLCLLPALDHQAQHQHQHQQQQQ
jgi:hypothetical protein